MHPVEVEDALESMVLLVDTREQQTPRSKVRYAQFGIPYERQTLNFGDYSAKVRMPSGEWHCFDREIVIERKLGLEELSACFFQERNRFTREFEQAKAAGARIYLLIENASWLDIIRHNYKTRVSPKAFAGSILAFEARYDCKVQFCSQLCSGSLIRDILHYEVRERLMSL